MTDGIKEVLVDNVFSTLWAHAILSSDEEDEEEQSDQKPQKIKIYFNRRIEDQPDDLPPPALTDDQPSEETQQRIGEDPKGRPNMQGAKAVFVAEDDEEL